MEGRMVNHGQAGLYLRFQADIWVEVDPLEGVVTAVVVDQRSMEHAVAVVNSAGAEIHGGDRADAEQYAAGEWPSWDYR